MVSQRTKVLKEPTCKAVGVGASVVSQHYDLVIPDDLINETNITTLDQIEKVKDWWRLAQSLGDGEQTEWRLVGTRYHYDDLYGEIITNQPDMYDIYIRKAIENGKPIYPSKFSLDHLEEIKRNQGSYIFSCQYFNDPIDDESAIFQKNWIKYYKDNDLKNVGKMNIFVTCDPAISEEASADETVFVVNGVDRFNNWWILDIVAGRMNSRKLIETIFDIDDRWQPKTFGIETQSFQKIIKYQLEDEMKAKNWWIPFTELKPDLRSKKSRIRGLQPRFEYGIIYLKENAHDTLKFVDQYLRFPKSLHDDYLDALAYQLDVAYPPKVETERKKKKRYLNPITKY